MALAATGIEEGNLIALSPLGPVAHSIGMQTLRLKPVFVDVTPNDACMDAELLSVRTSSGVKAIIVHAPVGMVPDMETIYNTGLPVIVDVGETLGAREENGVLGSRADYLILPMEANAIATAGGGTLVLSRTKSLLNALNVHAQKLAPDAFMSDINASLGLVQWLEHVKALNVRRAVFQIYSDAIRRGRHGILSNERPSIPWSFPVTLTSGVKEVSRYALKHGVETALAFSGRILELFPNASETCPNAGLLSIKTVLFPLYPNLSKKNVQLVAKVLSTLP